MENITVAYIDENLSVTSLDIELGNETYGVFVNVIKSAPYSSIVKNMEESEDVTRSHASLSEFLNYAKGGEKPAFIVDTDNQWRYSSNGSNLVKI